MTTPGSAGEALTARQRSRQYELLVTSIQDYAIFLMDPDGVIETWNVGAARLKGYAADEIVGRSFACFYTPAQRQAGRPRELLDRALRDGRVEDEGWRVRKDGTRFWADVVITALFEGGAHVGFAKLTRDLTERKAFEDALTRRSEALAEAGRLKDQFLSILSHELRTPLNAIMGFASILEDEVAGPLVPDQRTYVGRILTSTDALLGLINDLLDMSRIQAGKFQLQPAPTDVAGVVRGVVANMAALAARKELTLTLEPAVGLPPAMADAQRVGQVVMNLVGNAVKFTPTGGTIAVRLTACPGRLSCEVQDSGPGVPVGLRDKLFEPFFQLDGSSPRSGGGTGLGLSIAKALVEAHGGHIGVDSPPEGGATFWFELPLEDEAPAGPVGSVAAS